jgi:hypothetical protein
MTPHKAAFDTYNVISPLNVRLRGDNMAKVIGMGSIVMRIKTRGKMNTICITDVLHVPKLQANLLSMNKFLSNGLKV